MTCDVGIAWHESVVLGRDCEHVYDEFYEKLLSQEEQAMKVVKEGIKGVVSSILGLITAIIAAANDNIWVKTAALTAGIVLASSGLIAYFKAIKKPEYKLLFTGLAGALFTGVMIANVVNLIISSATLWSLAQEN